MFEKLATILSAPQAGIYPQTARLVSMDRVSVGTGRSRCGFNVCHFTSLKPTSTPYTINIVVKDEASRSLMSAMSWQEVKESMVHVKNFMPISRCHGQ